MNYADLVKIHYLYYKDSLKPRLRGTTKKTEKDFSNYKRFIPRGWNVIENFTDKNSMYFENENEIVIAMRGLHFGNVEDMYIGTNIISGDFMNPTGFDFETSRGKYKDILIEEQQKIDIIKKNYPDKKIILAGHSRGGRKAIDLGMHNDLEFHAYNPGDASTLRDKVYSISLPYILKQFSTQTENIEVALGWTLTSPTFQTLNAPSLKQSGLLNKLGVTNLFHLNEPIINAGLRAGIGENPITTSGVSILQDIIQPLKQELITTTMAGGNPYKTIKYGFPDARIFGSDYYGQQEITKKEINDYLMDNYYSRGIEPPDFDFDKVVDDYMLDLYTQASREHQMEELKDYTGGIYGESQLTPRKYANFNAITQHGNRVRLADAMHLRGKELMSIIKKGYELAQQPLTATQPIKEILSKGHIYSTERDIVSSGYKGSKLQSLIGVRPDIIKPKDYVNDFDPTHHSIDHFASRELFESIKDNKNINNVLDQDIIIKSRFDINNSEIGNVGGFGREKLNINRFCNSFPDIPECQYLKSL